MSQTTPRKYQSSGRGHQSQSSFSQSHSPHSHSHAHAHTHSHSHSQQHNQYQHARNRSQHLRAEEQGGQSTTGGSDYESDMAAYVSSQSPALVAPAALAARTNTELNMAVLRRYRPRITSILSIAANAVVYSFASKWDKANLEGTLFICAQDRDEDESSISNGCLFVLNRKGLQNLAVELSNVEHFELSNDTLIFKLDEESATVPMENGESVRSKALGMYIYAETDQDRRMNAALINEMWIKARAAREDAEGASVDASTSTSSPSNSNSNSNSNSEEAEMAQSMREAGRQLSLTELFKGGQNGFRGL
ncbi:PH domain-like protein [Jackrogersella minutella]|nr:PH domain-like protein [Jackrogersella minutella]